MVWRGDRLKNQTQVPRICCHACRYQPSSCRHAGGSRTAKRTPVARAVRMMCIAIVALPLALTLTLSLALALTLTSLLHLQKIRLSL